MELDREPVRRGHTKQHVSVCAHTHSYAPLLRTLREKYNFLFDLEGLGSSVTTLACSKRKSFCYLKHTRVNNKGLIHLALCLYFLVK